MRRDLNRRREKLILSRKKKLTHFCGSKMKNFHDFSGPVAHLLYLRLTWKAQVRWRGQFANCFDWLLLMFERKIFYDQSNYKTRDGPFVPKSALPLSDELGYFIETAQFVHNRLPPASGDPGPIYSYCPSENTPQFPKFLKTLNLGFLGTGFGLVCISFHLPQLYW